MDLFPGTRLASWRPLSGTQARSTPLEDAFWSLRAHAVDVLPPVVAAAASDCLWMARVAIKMLVRALRVRLHLVTAAGRDCNMEN